MEIQTNSILKGQILQVSRLCVDSTLQHSVGTPCHWFSTPLGHDDLRLGSAS